MAKPCLIVDESHIVMSRIAKAIEAGANEYIMKPFDSELVDTKPTSSVWWKHELS